MQNELDKVSSQKINDWRYPELIAKIFFLFIIAFWIFELFKPNDTGIPPWIFLDFANLIFHEAGHFIFAFFGQFLHILGGSLTQLLVPIIVSISFIKTKQYYSAGFAIFWLGDNMINLSYYIGDAQTRVLPLLGGDGATHDWWWILTTLNILTLDWLIAAIAYIAGTITIVTGLAIMITNCLFLIKNKGKPNRELQNIL